MQPRTLDTILNELNSVYAPQESLIQRRQADIPNQTAADEQALRAQEQNYHDNTIMGDARRRGIAFGGIPLGERAQYGATNFLPALARLKQQGREQAMTLEDALLQLNERKRQTGLGIYQNEQQMAEQRRQFDTQLALEREKMAQSQRAAVAQEAANRAYLDALMKQNQPVAQPQNARPTLDSLFPTQQDKKTQVVAPSLPTGKTPSQAMNSVLNFQPGYGVSGFRNVTTSGISPLRGGF